MDEKEPSRTAIRTAMFRALAYLLDDEPKILDDALARPLAGFATDTDFLEDNRQQPLGNIEWLRTNFSIRSRYTEDTLAEAYARGVRQKRDAIAGLGEPRAASAVEARQDRRRVKELERELHRKDKALAETAALLVLSKKLSAVFHQSEDE